MGEPERRHLEPVPPPRVTAEGSVEPSSPSHAPAMSNADHFRNAADVTHAAQGSDGAVAEQEFVSSQQELPSITEASDGTRDDCGQASRYKHASMHDQLEARSVPAAAATWASYLQPERPQQHHQQQPEQCQPPPEQRLLQNSQQNPQQLQQQLVPEPQANEVPLRPQEPPWLSGCGLQWQSDRSSLLVALPSDACAAFLAGEASGVASKAGVKLQAWPADCCGSVGSPPLLEITGTAVSNSVAAYLVQEHIWL